MTVKWLTRSHGTAMARTVLANPWTGLGWLPNEGPMATNLEFGADDINCVATLGKVGLFP